MSCQEMCRDIAPRGWYKALRAPDGVPTLLVFVHLALLAPSIAVVIQNPPLGFRSGIDSVFAHEVAPIDVDAAGRFAVIYRGHFGELPVTSCVVNGR